MQRVGQQSKRTITGDYYEIHKNGIYRRHTDVSVHCHHSDIIQQKGHLQNMTENSLEKQEHRKKIQSIKSRFAQNCKQILEKQQVNSIHEQDQSSPPLPHQQAKVKNNSHYAERRQKNMNMRRSTQNETSPKKGILKRSLIDKKQEEGLDNEESKVYKIDNKSVIANNEMYTKIQMSPALAQSQFEFRGQQFNKSSLSWGKGEHQKNTKKYCETESATQKSINEHTALTDRGVENITRSNIKTKRQNTEGRQTVAILPNKNSARQEQANSATLDMYSNCAFEEAVYEQIQFLKERFLYLEKQLVQSEQRMKRYDLERQFNKTKSQIQKIKRENQVLRNIKQSKQSKQKSSLNMEGVQDVIKLVSKNSTFLISFLLALLVCLSLGKSTTTCSK